jgi:hypothetical protein
MKVLSLKTVLIVSFATWQESYPTSLSRNPSDPPPLAVATR